jgi:signal transduction histidine kinase
MKIQTKTTLLFTAITATVFVALSLTIYFFADKFAHNDFYKRIELRARISAKFRFEQDHVSAETYKEIQRQYLERLTDEKAFIVQVDDKGNFIQQAGQVLPLSYLEDIVNANGNTVFFQQKGRYYAGLLYPDETGNWLVIKSATNAYGSEVMMHLRNTLIITLLLAIASIYLAGRYFSRKTFQPFRSITSRVRQISEGSLHLRLEKQESIDEISELVRTFNHMLDRLETAFEAQNNFISNASHELRTPLTAIVAEADYALSRERSSADYRHSMQHIVQQAEKLQHLIKGLLALAQTGFEGKKQIRESVRLDQLVFDVKENVDAILPENKVRVHISDMPTQDADICLSGNNDLLKVALGNIVLNACKYSNNEEVTVSLSVLPKEGIIEVTDRGIGIPAHELRHIYEPFFRASNAKSYK